MSHFDLLKRWYYAYRRHVPARLLYHPAYFAVQRRLERQDREGDGAALPRSSVPACGMC